MIASVLRAAVLAAATTVRATPHWVERAAAGQIDPALEALASGALTDDERAALAAERERQDKLRAKRRHDRALTPGRMHRAPYVRHGIIVWLTWDALASPRFYRAQYDGDAVGEAMSIRGAVRRALARRRRPVAGGYTRREISIRRPVWGDGTAAWSWRDQDLINNFRVRPTDADIARLRADAARRRDAEVRLREILHLAAPDPAAPDHLGWRVWDWDPAQRCLVSPVQHTPWPTPELRATAWVDSDALRGVAGIHARRLPRDWRRAPWIEMAGDGAPTAPELIVGLVERYGRYVLGTEGWRAEWVVIRALRAPSTEIGLALEAAYPDVEVVYEDR